MTSEKSWPTAWASAFVTATIHRAVQRLGYRYRRPRHYLRHRQDLEAVAATDRGAWPGCEKNH